MSEKFRINPVILCVHAESFFTRDQALGRIFRNGFAEKDRTRSKIALLTATATWCTGQHAGLLLIIIEQQYN